MNPLPPLDWLRTFEAAARLQSFSAAAEELHLTQAGVSQQIRKLEARLGVDLFKRLPRSVEITLQGESFLPYVRHALETLTRGTADLFYTQQRRTISIVAPASLNAFWLSPRLNTIKKALPQINLSIFSIYRHADYNTIDADIEIRFGTGNWNSETQQLLFNEVLSPVCSANLAKKRNYADWKDLPKISLTGLRSSWATWNKVIGDDTPIKTNLSFDSMLIALEAVKSGSGVLLASLPLMQHLIDEGELIRLSEFELKTEEGYWVSRKATRKVDPISDDFYQFICQQANC